MNMTAGVVRDASAWNVVDQLGGLATVEKVPTKANTTLTCSRAMLKKPTCQSQGGILARLGTVLRGVASLCSKLFVAPVKNVAGRIKAFLTNPNERLFDKVLFVFAIFFISAAVISMATAFAVNPWIPAALFVAGVAAAVGTAYIHRKCVDNALEDLRRAPSEAAQDAELYARLYAESGCSSDVRDSVVSDASTQSLASWVSDDERRHRRDSFELARPEYRF